MLVQLIWVHHHVILPVAILLVSSVPLYAIGEDRGPLDKFSPGIDSPEPTKMYDQSIAEPDEHFVLIRGFGEKKEKPKKEKKAVKKPELKVIAPTTTNEIPKKDEPTPSTREGIVAIYGDPTGATPITAEDNAPKPFKAIHAAFEAGDEELAFNYARQYVRRTAKLKARMSDVMGALAKAMELEGLQDGEGWTNSKEYAKFNKYVEAAIAEEQEKLEQQELSDPYLSVLPVKLREIAKSPSTSASDSELQLEGFHRETMSQHLATVTPRSLDGVVNLTLFIEPKGHKESLQMARELSPLAKILKRNPSVTFNLVSKGYHLDDTKKNFKLRSGHLRTEFIEDLPEDNLPSSPPELWIEIPSLNKEIVIQGLRRGYYVQELVEIIHGGELR